MSVSMTAKLLVQCPHLLSRCVLDRLKN